MKKVTVKEWREIHIKKTMEYLGITRQDYEWFMIIGNKLHREFERQCNGFKDINDNWDEKATIASERYEEELKEKASHMAQQKGLYIFFQTDPRGATIYLDKKPIQYNAYNNAYCIY